MPEDISQRQQRKQKDISRDSVSPSVDPTPTDIVERMIAFQRKQASATRTREKVDKPQSTTRTMPIIGPSSPSPPHKPSTSPLPSHQPPQLIIFPAKSPDIDEQSRRRKAQVSSSPRQSHSRPQIPNGSGKLYNPGVDPIPMRRTAEPEAMSDNGSSAYAPRVPLQARESTGHGVLYDPHKHNPMTFNNVHGRPAPSQASPLNGRPLPTPKSSGEYVSASSTSSYTRSITSSSFTLSSTTDGSSASSALFEQQKSGQSGTSAFAAQLKMLYRSMCSLEAALSKDDSKDVHDEARITLKRPNSAMNKDLDMEEKEKWAKFRADHKQLAEDIHEILLLTSAPHVPASLRIIPAKYNIITRLWTYAFNKPLETLRRASHQSQIALEHLHEFIIYAYKFYSILLEEQTLENYKNGWLEALGDLSRYRMMIAAMVTPSTTIVAATEPFAPISQKILPQQPNDKAKEASVKLDDSQCPSVGIAAAALLELQPETERWRCIARDWYAAGLSDTPGAGKLHHCLGLLSRDVEDEELRAVYHFVKNLTALHPYNLSRETILPMWSIPLQARRAQPDAHVSDLFVHLHGMLFTNVQLDDFPPTLARFAEKLQLEGAEEREWVMMGIINIAAILQYGKPTSLLKRAGGRSNNLAKDAHDMDSAKAKVNIVTKKMDEMEVDDDYDLVEKTTGDKDKDFEMTDEKDSHVPPSTLNAMAIEEEPSIPLSLKYALQLTFAMLSFTLRNPTRKATSFSRPTLNPYNSILLTFLSTVLKNESALTILERAIPWRDMAAFFCTMSRRAIREAEGGLRLTSGCTPLPEDWCIRGMEWSRRVYDRGFWKSGEERHPEMDVLDHIEVIDGATDGIIEDDGDDEAAKTELSENGKRWVRIIRSAAGIATVVPGFEKEPGQMKWRVTGVLEEKVGMWKEEERKEREEDERRRQRRRRNDDDMDVDDEDNAELDDTSEDSEDSDDDSEEIKILKARRRELLRLLHSAKQGKPSQAPKRRSKPRGSRKQQTVARPTLKVVAGYTVLIADTNILLSSLKIFATLVESLRWTIVVPLAVVTELDGLKTSNSPLGEAANAAVQYIISHLRSHSKSLKVQTSKGNYLSTLSVRSEEVDFTHESWERSMDDLILRAAIWHDEHWVDRSTILDSEIADTASAAKVVLVSFDRNLRLKARSKQLNAADEKGLAAILKAGS